MIDQNRKKAIWIAAQIFSSGEKMSIRKIAKAMDLEASTVSRWFKKGELEQEVKRMRGWFKKPSELSRKIKP